VEKPRLTYVWGFRSLQLTFTVTLTETQCIAEINSIRQTCQDALALEDWLEAQPQRFAMLGVNADSYNVVVWVMSQFFGTPKSWWLHRKERATILYSFDSVLVESCKTSMLPNILDEATHALLGLTQGTLSYASYTQLFNDLLQRSRQHLTDDLHCVRFINELANFQLHA
jgi:hypothetical protein